MFRFRPWETTNKAYGEHASSKLRPKIPTKSAGDMVQDDINLALSKTLNRSLICVAGSNLTTEELEADGFKTKEKGLEGRWF